jgi:hypothetical protein
MAKENFDDGLMHADIAVDLASQPDAKQMTGISRDVDLMALGAYLLRQAECHAERGEWDKARACVDRARTQAKAEPEGNLKMLLKERADFEAAEKAAAEKAAAEQAAKEAAEQEEEEKRKAREAREAKEKEGK